MSKSTHSKLTKQQSTNSDRNVVSDTELDLLLEEVEMIQKKKESKKSLTRKSAGDNLFTKEDEKALKEIFNNVERRKKEYEDLRLASSQSRDIADDVLDSTSSESSKNSSDNESEDNSSSSKVSDDNSSDQESADDEVDLTTDDEDNSKVNENKRQQSKKKVNKSVNSINAEEGHLTNDTGKKASSGFNDKRVKKVQKTNKSGSNRKPQADEDLDSMVAELLEF